MRLSSRLFGTLVGILVGTLIGTLVGSLPGSLPCSFFLFTVGFPLRIFCLLGGFLGLNSSFHFFWGHVFCERSWRVGIVASVGIENCSVGQLGAPIWIRDRSISIGNCGCTIRSCGIRWVIGTSLSLSSSCSSGCSLVLRISTVLVDHLDCPVELLLVPRQRIDSLQTLNIGICDLSCGYCLVFLILQHPSLVDVRANISNDLASYSFFRLSKMVELLDDSIFLVHHLLIHLLLLLLAQIVIVRENVNELVGFLVNIERVLALSMNDSRFLVNDTVNACLNFLSFARFFLIVSLLGLFR